MTVSRRRISYENATVKFPNKTHKKLIRKVRGVRFISSPVYCPLIWRGTRSGAHSGSIGISGIVKTQQTLCLSSLKLSHYCGSMWQGTGWPGSAIRMSIVWGYYGRLSWIWLAGRALLRLARRPRLVTQSIISDAKSSTGYFVYPFARFPQGLNENLNGLFHQYTLKKTSFDLHKCDTYTDRRTT